MRFVSSTALALTLLATRVVSSTVELDEERLLRGDTCGEKGSLNILLTNDDGFDIPNVQELLAALKHAGHKVLLVAPYSGQSGSAASLDNVFLSYTNKFADADPPLDVFAAAEVGATTTDSECGTISAGADPLAKVHPGQYYVDGPPSLSVFFGLDVVGPAYFHGEDIDLVISGPNTGNNLGLLSVHSGTIGAAVTAMNRGYPAIAVSADGGLDGDDDCNPTQNDPELVAAIALKVVESVICGDEVTLKPFTGLTVNLPATNGRNVHDVDKYKFEHTEISIGSRVGFKFFETLLDCDFYLASLSPEQIELLKQFGNFPGLCVTSPYTDAGYPLDTNEKGEYNTIVGDPDLLTVSISKIQSNYQAPVKKHGRGKGSGGKGKGKGKGKGGKGKGKSSKGSKGSKGST